MGLPQVGISFHTLFFSDLSSCSRSFVTLWLFYTHVGWYNLLTCLDLVASVREERNLPPLRCFVIDVVSSTSANLHEEDMDMLRKAKMSSTYIRQWIVSRQKLANTGS